jgi:hypothetical protein
MTRSRRCWDVRVVGCVDVREELVDVALPFQCLLLQVVNPT